ncbi:MAG TPA: hypothetical protein PLS63_09870, partial [Microthrixaceae bacterium]|nr:hypothetical protein [Microthrixaceae bacterium]
MSPEASSIPSGTNLSIWSVSTDAFPADLAARARRWVTEAADRARRDQAQPASVRLYTQALDLL